MRACLWRLLLPALLPALLIGPALLPGRVFLPLLPVALPPLAQEYPIDAAQALANANFLATDALFPLLSDAREMRAQIWRGALPLWNERQGLGAPLAGGSMFGPWHPLHWLAFVMQPERALGWIALAGLVLAGLGMQLFLERLGLSAVAAAVGMLALQGGGFALANLHLGVKVEAALGLPFALWAIEGLVRRARGAMAVLFAATLSGFLAGFPPIAVFATLCAFAYAIWRRYVDHERELQLGRALAVIALGVAAAAVQLVPTLEASRRSLRGLTTAAELAAQALPAASLYTLAAPFAFGRPSEPVFAPQYTMVWWKVGDAGAAASANLLEWNLACGTAVIVLAAAALARGRRAACAVVFVALALGFVLGLPGAQLAYRVPGLNLGAPARAAAVLWVAWAWLAALGVDALRERPKPAVLLGAAAALGLAGLGLGMRTEIGDSAAWAAAADARLAERFAVTAETVARYLPLELRQRAADQWRASGTELAAVALACAILLGLTAFSRGRARTAVLLVLAGIVAAEGVRFGREHLCAQSWSPDVALFPPSTGFDAIRRAAGDGRVLRLDESDSGIADVVDLARPNLPEVYGVRDLTPYIAFTPREPVELLAAMDPRTRYLTGASRLPDERLLRHRILDVLRVTAIVARRQLRHPRLQPVLEREGFFVYRRTGVPPRARFVEDAIPTQSDAAALEVLAQGLLDPATHAVLAPGVHPPPWMEAGPPLNGGKSDVELLQSAPARLVLRATTANGGWLVLADAWAPGWRASVDGRPAALERVDHALRAVAVPQGSHEVRFAYAPGALKGGLGISAAATLCAIWLFRGARRQHLGPATHTGG